MAEDEQGKKSQKNHGKEMPGQKIPDYLGRLKMDQDAAGNDKQTEAKDKP
jgi:hypothetical protein